MSRISSLSALVATLATLAYIVTTSQTVAATAAIVIMTALIFWKHRENIGRLLRGEESRIGAKG